MSTSQRGGDHGNRGEPSSTFDSEAVPSLLAEQIVPLLHVVNEVESSDARIAFVRRSYALQKVKRLDPTFRGRGVHQFQSRLERHIKGVNDPTSRDALEMKGFYLRYYKQFIQALENDAGKADCLPWLTKLLMRFLRCWNMLKRRNPLIRR
ncbi:hypothetical protein NL676_007191 [Syzygium grande]|nr:hypothetical protein NL676_007191 [Syzygium grande]